MRHNSFKNEERKRLKQMKVYIVRHGQTLFNYLERVQGWSDSPLTEKGLEQAKAVANHLASVSFDAVYSSDLMRAIHTAEYILEKQTSSTELQTTELLREAYFGGFEGGTEDGPWGPVFKTFGYDPEEIKTNFSSAMNKVLENHSNQEVRNIIAANDPLGLAENYDQYFNRIDEFLKQFILNAKEAENILVVSHGGTSKLLTELLLNDSSDILEQDNCSTTVVEVGLDINILLDFNNTSYL